MRKLMTGLVAVGLVLAGFIARDLMLLGSANAAVAGLDHIGLRMDLDFRDVPETLCSIKASGPLVLESNHHSHGRGRQTVE